MTQKDMFMRHFIRSHDGIGWNFERDNFTESLKLPTCFSGYSKTIQSWLAFYLVYISRLFMQLMWENAAMSIPRQILVLLLAKTVVDAPNWMVLTWNTSLSVQHLSGSYHMISVDCWDKGSRKCHETDITSHTEQWSPKSFTYKSCIFCSIHNTFQ